MSVHQRGDRWIVSFHDQNKKRQDKSFGTGDYAEQLARAFELAVKDAKLKGWPEPWEDILVRINLPQPAPIPTVTNTDKNRLTFGELCQSYLEELEVRGRTPGHIQTMRIVIDKCYYPHLDKEKAVVDMTYLDDIKPFIQAMRQPSSRTGRPRSNITINRYANYLDAIFNFGLKVWKTSNNPMENYTKLKETPRKVSLTVEDIRKIMDAASEHIRWAIELNFNLGARSGPSELLSLTWDKVNFSTGMVEIFATKTQTTRDIPVSKAFLKKLKEKKKVAKTNYLVEYKGRQVKTLRRGFNAACEKAGLPYDARMYDLRHMFATSMITEGADIAAVSKLMGHSKLSTTVNNYYHLLPGEKEKAINRLPAL